MKITDEMVNAADSVLSRRRPGIPDETIRMAIAAALAVQTQQGAGKEAIKEIISSTFFLKVIFQRTATGKTYYSDEDEKLFDSLVESAASRIAALVDVPAVESEPVAWRWKFDPDADWHYGGKEPRGFRFGDPEIVEVLYAHPPRSLSSEGDEMLHLAVAAVLEADTEFRAQMMPGWDGDPLSDELDGLRRIFATLSTRKGSAGDGSATSTKDADHG